MFFSTSILLKRKKLVNIVFFSRVLIFFLRFRDCGQNFETFEENPT
ncbi:unnamed protein product [Arabidopsis halleri]